MALARCALLLLPSSTTYSTVQVIVLGASTLAERTTLQFVIGIQERFSNSLDTLLMPLHLRFPSSYLAML